MTHGLTSHLHTLHAALAPLRRHPRRVALAALASISTFAVTAFGIAPLAANDQPLVQRAVSEPLPLAHLGSQLEALAAHNLDLHRSTVTRASDTVDGLLRRLGVSDPLAANHLRTDPDARQLLNGDGGNLVQARTAEDGTLLELVARYSDADPARADTHFTRLTVRRSGALFASRVESAELQRQVRLGSATVRGSLWAATEQARLPEAIADQMVEIFAGEVDFHRELRKGDAFSVVYETLSADGEPITWGEGAGRVLAAEYTTSRGRRHQALWFQESSTGKGAYFNADGRSRRRPFLASPVEFSRVTSGFAERMHPILQTWRAHNGVDYAAPTGTAVRSVGDGTVEFAGQQSGYGNVVQVQHLGGKSTLYAHLSRMDVKVGDRITQGQTIGAVGATGWATGPHLHFEFRVNGQFQDPLLVANVTETFALDAVSRPRFQQWARTARYQLAAAESVGRFRGDAE